jgi:hypothetical protein
MAEANRFVLDSFALIGYLENEPFAGSIQDILRSALKNNAVFSCMRSTLEKFSILPDVKKAAKMPTLRISA